MNDTAIEWFFIQLTEIDYGCINKTFLQNDNTLAGHKLRELFEQAKEMERQQIMTAFTQGDIFGADYYDGVNITEENYYNQTFK